MYAFLEGLCAATYSKLNKQISTTNGDFSFSYDGKKDSAKKKSRIWAWNQTTQCLSVKNTVICEDLDVNGMGSVVHDISANDYSNWKSNVPFAGGKF